MARNTEVITIEDILKRKDFFKNKKKETKKLYVKSIDACIVVEKPDKELLFDVQEMDDEFADSYLVYECLKEPNLHSPEVLEAFKDKIKEPTDILFEIFDTFEVADIARKLVAMSGYDGVEEVEELKK